LSGETYDARKHVIRIDIATIHDDLIVLKQGSQVVVNKSLDDYEKKKIKVEDDKLNKDLGEKTINHRQYC
jgi:PHD/YefM family antitoxin component YafN of YafNO toxin-antitoxin module